MRKQYKYDAFISYRHTDLDKFVAEKVHKYLESFKLPKSVKGKKELEKTKIERVFRDKEELTITNNLEDPIIQALKDSEYLIVICSPRTKESVWCSKEIEKFIEFHGRNKILTVLIEGEPSESFPEQLLYEKEVVIENGIETIYRKGVEPLAADIRANSKSKMYKLLKSELLRVIAPMFGLEYDDLRQRHRERRIKKIMTATIAAATLGISIGVAGILSAMKIKEQSIEIEKNNKLLLTNQAENLAEESNEMLGKDDRNAAISLAVDSLTEYDGLKLPYTAQGKYALIQGLRVYDNGEVIKAIQQFETESNISQSMVNSTGEYLMALDSMGKIYVWNVEDNKLIFNSQEGSVCECPIFVGSDKIAYVEDSDIMYVCNLKNGETVAKIEDLDITNINSDTNGEYIVLNSMDNVYVYDAESLSSIYEKEISSDAFCNDALVAENWLVYNETEGSVTEIGGRSSGKMYFVNMKDTSSSFSLDNEYTMIESIKYDDGKLYLSLNSILTTTDTLSAVMAVDTKSKKLVWKEEFNGILLDKVRVIDVFGEKKIVTSSYSELLFMDANTGEVECEQTFNNGIVNYTNFVDGKCFVFDKEGGYTYVDMVENNYAKMEYLFECNIDRIWNFMICTKGYLVQADNRVVLYNYNENPDAKEYEGDEEFLQDSETSENAQDKAKELGAVNYKLAWAVLYTDDKDVAFVSYENDMVEIYDVKEKKLINKLEEVDSNLVKYLGKDKEGNIYVSCDTMGICLDSEYNLIAKIDKLLHMDADKNVIIVDKGEGISLEIPIYSTDELVEKGKELLETK